MSETSVSRVAELHLRGVDRLLPARVFWPTRRATMPALAIHLGSPAEAAKICRHGYIVLAVDAPVDDAQRIVEWAAAHGPELGASHRLVAAGPGAVDIVRRSRQADWPPIELLSDEFADSDSTNQEGDRMTNTKTHTLDVPRAVLTYDIHEPHPEATHLCSSSDRRWGPPVSPNWFPTSATAPSSHTTRE